MSKKKKPVPEYDLGGVLSGAATGAMSGASLGLPGAIVGGGVGILTSLLGDRKAKKEESANKKRAQRMADHYLYLQDSAFLDQYNDALNMKFGGITKPNAEVEKSEYLLSKGIPKVTSGGSLNFKGKDPITGENLFKVQGKTHNQGGVKIDAPNNTKVISEHLGFSDLVDSGAAPSKVFNAQETSKTMKRFKGGGDIVTQEDKTKPKSNVSGHNPNVTWLMDQGIVRKNKQIQDVSRFRGIVENAVNLDWDGEKLPLGEVRNRILSDKRYPMEQRGKNYEDVYKKHAVSWLQSLNNSDEMLISDDLQKRYSKDSDLTETGTLPSAYQSRLEKGGVIKKYLLGSEINPSFNNPLKGITPKAGNISKVNIPKKTSKAKWLTNKLGETDFSDAVPFVSDLFKLTQQPPKPIEPVLQGLMTPEKVSFDSEINNATRQGLAVMKGMDATTTGNPNAYKASVLSSVLDQTNKVRGEEKRTNAFLRDSTKRINADITARNNMLTNQYFGDLLQSSVDRQRNRAEAIAGASDKFTGIQDRKKAQANLDREYQMFRKYYEKASDFGKIIKG
jgi:hypothetical protein